MIDMICCYLSLSLSLTLFQNEEESFLFFVFVSNKYPKNCVRNEIVPLYGYDDHHHQHDELIVIWFWFTNTIQNHHYHHDHQWWWLWSRISFVSNIYNAFLNGSNNCIKDMRWNKQQQQQISKLRKNHFHLKKDDYY